MAQRKDIEPMEGVPDTSPIKRQIELENIMSEQEAMQQETMSRLPGPVAFLIQYELEPLIRIIAMGIILAILYFLVGLDVVFSSLAIFAVVFVIVYWAYSRRQEQSYTYFFETRKAGQVIEKGEHMLYKNSFVVQTDRVSFWMVPNHLIERGIFRLPSAYEMPPLPAGNNIIFVDYFDEHRRTVVFPKKPDIANISFDTNMNPNLQKKLDNVADDVDHAERIEYKAMELYQNGQITLQQVQDLLKESHKQRLNALKDPISTRRDIINDLQRTIPEYQDKIRYLQDNIYLLANEMATAGIYQLLKIPMPDKIRKDHNFIRAIYGLPKFKGPKGK